MEWGWLGEEWVCGRRELNECVEKVEKSGRRVGMAM